MVVVVGRLPARDSGTPVLSAVGFGGHSSGADVVNVDGSNQLLTGLEGAVALARGGAVVAFTHSGTRGRFVVPRRRRVRCHELLPLGPQCLGFGGALGGGDVARRAFDRPRRAVLPAPRG